MIRYILIITLSVSAIYAKSATVSDMISQMLIVGFSGANSSDKWTQQIANDVEKNKIGGVYLRKENIKNPIQLKKLTKFLLEVKSKKPIWIGIEQVGGKINGLTYEKGFIGFENQKNISRKKTILESYDIYVSMAKELKKYSINLDFSPSVDLANTKENYSSMEEIVIAYSNEFLKAFYKNSILTTLKYFPGKSGLLWKYNELKPYYDFIKYKKARAIMIGSQIYPSFDDKNPAFMSKKIVQNLLQNKLKFKGVIFSDNLQKKEIINKYKLKQIVIKSINAGVNVLVFASYFSKDTNIVKRVRKIIINAVDDGEIDGKLIENSYKKVIKLKREMK